MISPSRRTVLRNSLLAVPAFLPAASFGEAGRRSLRTISIFHTTDLHGHIRPTQMYNGIGNVGGLARCAAQIRTWRRESPDSLLVDVGDVYQGTPLGWLTRGRLMIDLFNRLRYDAWVLGNHEFDWGPEVVRDAVGRSQMPVLAANMKVEGRRAGELDDPGNPLAGILPHVIKEVGGFRIGLVGLTTPGLPYWLRPELLEGFEATDPAAALRASSTYLREEGRADAVIACGHMGLRDEDDFANHVRELLEQEEGPDVYLGGHTHRDQGSRFAGRTLYSQANYFGIHCGRVDLSFDLESRRLVDRRAYTLLMDERIAEDPLVLEVAGPQIEEADAHLVEKMGELEVELSDRAPAPGAGSPLQGLLAKAFLHAAQEEKIDADGVFHGTFGSGPMAAGPKTIADAWKLLPYDNRLVVLSLTREELLGILNESLGEGGDRALFGFELEVARTERNRLGERGAYFVRSLRSVRRAGPHSAQMV